MQAEVDRVRRELAHVRSYYHSESEQAALRRLAELLDLPVPDDMDVVRQAAVATIRMAGEHTPRLQHAWESPKQLQKVRLDLIHQLGEIEADARG